MSENREEPSRLHEALRKKVHSAQEANRTPGTTVSGTGGSERSFRPAMQKILRQRITFLGPNVRDMAVFCRQLATLLEVGIPLVRSLRILADRSQHPRLRKVSAMVARDVEEGNRLSDAFEKHPRIFPALLVNVARVGEAGGILEPSLNRLADTMEQKLIIRRKITGALMYPITALIVATCVLLLILVYAIPVFSEVYRDTGAELPALTQMIISLSNFAQKFWWLILLGIILAVVLLIVIGRTPPGRRAFDWIRLKAPVVGGINTKINVARVTRNLGNLLTAGIPLMDALAIVARTSENVVVGEALENARENIEAGGKIDEPLRRSHVFPPMVVDMVTIGDEAGALDTMLLKVADIYDEDVDAALKGMSSLVEPLLIVLLGGAVILIALAVLLPYFSLASVAVVE